jgi:N-carbamoyl-L-amino-acid hydrolase
MTERGAALEPVAERIKSDLTELAQLRDPDHPGWTREGFSDAYRHARDWVSAKMRSAGLRVRRDRAGNVVGVLPGRSSAAPALVTGSHTDTVKGGGRFDGTVGVLGAIEVVRLLRESGTELTRDLVVVDFLGEESNDWGLSCLGSRALSGELRGADLDRRDGSGRRLGEQYESFGLDPSGALGERWLTDRPVHGYVELHIEQGPMLEEKGATIGVVSAIAGIERLSACFQGRPDHAGTRPMDDRRDAMVAAAHAVLAVHQEGRSAPRHGVATTTELVNALPAPNVVPASVWLRAEVRSIDEQWLAGAKHRLAHDILTQARALGVDVSFDWTSDNTVVPASRSIQDSVAHAAERAGLAWTRLASGATHDAAHVARRCPMGMIFVPSRGGRSHCPEEWTDLADITAGVGVLGETLRMLDAQQDLGAATS